MHIYKQSSDTLRYPSILRFFFFFIIIILSHWRKKVKIKEDKDVPHYHINNHKGISECMINILGVIERQRWSWTSFSLQSLFIGFRRVKEELSMVTDPVVFK